MKLKSFDNYLILSMIILAMISLYMLYGAKNTQHSQAEIKVATIVEQLKTVKRKKDFYEGWVDVKSGDTLSQNEQIYTHGQSSAKINFINGPEISLFENSLLRIKNTNKESAFKLDKGNIIAKLDKNNSKLAIEVNGKPYFVESTNANVQIEQTQNQNKFILLEGNAQLGDQKIRTNQVLIQDVKTGSMKIKDIPFILKSPKQNSSIYFSNQKEIKFLWDNSQNDIADIVIATDANFSRIIYQNKTEQNFLNHSFIQPGLYFWKIVSKDLIESPIRSFALIQESPPEIRSERDRLYINVKNYDKALIEWSKNGGENFVLEITDPQLNTEEILLKKNTYQFQPKLLGRYSIKVQVKDLNRPEAIWSLPLNLESREEKPGSIKSLTPDYIEKVNYKNSPDFFTLNWENPSISDKYKIIISKDNKKEIIETDSNYYSLLLKETGLYKWSVTAISSSGVPSNTIKGEILIKPPLRLKSSPSEGAIIILEKPDQLVNFKWDNLKDSYGYIFELSKDSNFVSSEITKETNTNIFNTTIGQMGKYYWRVKVKNGNGVDFSSPVSVEIKPAPPLNRPEINPDIKVKLKFIEETSSWFKFLDFFISSAHAESELAVAEWDLPANSRAKIYLVEIYADARLEKKLTTIETNSPKVVWKKATPGIYYWRVSYVDYWDRKTLFSDLSTLTVETENKEIELISPTHREQVLEKNTDKAEFIWSQDQGLSQYHFQIDRTLDFINPIFIKKIKNNKIILSCDDLKLPAGNYYWKVSALVSSSKRRAFSIKCEPDAIETIAEDTNIKQTEKTEQLSYTKKSVFAEVSYAPHVLNYQNTASQYTAKISGSVINSWQARFLNNNLEGKIDLSRGKVFNTISFNDFEMNFRWHRLKEKFSWGPVFGFLSKTIYVESNLKIVDEKLSSPLIGVFISTHLNALEVNGEVKYGTLLNLAGSLDYHLENNYSYGAFFDLNSTTKNNNKHQFIRFGLRLSYAFDFSPKRE